MVDEGRDIENVDVLGRAVQEREIRVTARNGQRSGFIAEGQDLVDRDDFGERPAGGVVAGEAGAHAAPPPVSSLAAAKSFIALKSRSIIADDAPSWRARPAW